MQNPKYAADFNELIGVCKERNVAVQTIKSVAQRLWKDEEEQTMDTWYKPLEEGTHIEKAIHWVLDENPIFIPTPGETEILSKVLAAADSYSPGSGPRGRGRWND